MDCYELCQIGLITWFLGIWVLHNWANKKLWLLQDSYINKIANQFHLTHKQPGKHLFTPIAIDGLALFEGQSTEAKWHEYMQKVGSLLYATIITHPDTAKVLWVLLYKPWKLWVWPMASMTTLGIHWWLMKSTVKSQKD